MTGQTPRAQGSSPNQKVGVGNGFSFVTTVSVHKLQRFRDNAEPVVSWVQQISKASVTLFMPNTARTKAARIQAGFTPNLMF